MTTKEKILYNKKMNAYDRAHVDDRSEFIKRRKLDKVGDKKWLKYAKRVLKHFDKMQRVSRRWYGYTIRMAIRKSSPHVDLN